MGCTVCTYTRHHWHHKTVKFQLIANGKDNFAPRMLCGDLLLG